MADITSFLVAMRNGEVANDINAHFDEVLRAVLETRGKGKLTIELSIEPSKCAIGGAVLEVRTEHKCKMVKPELAVGTSLFFVTAEGELTREDPAQTAMFTEQQQQQAQVQRDMNGRQANGA